MAKRYYQKSGEWKGGRRRSGTTSKQIHAFLHGLRRGSIVKNMLTLGLLAGVFGLFVLAVLFAIYSRDLPDPNQLTSRNVIQSTKIYDKTGEHLLYEIHGGEKRTLKKLQEGFCLDDKSLAFDEDGIPLYAVEAIIATEDHKFCTHGGFSFTGLARAVLFGGSRGGGSTLTQQLVPYGSTNYGIESAARAYFGKTVKDLTLAESATLAGLPKAPTTYLNNPEKLKDRRDFILSEMRGQEFITKAEYETALSEETPITFRVNDIVAPHFVFYVKEQLEETYGQRAVEQGGLKVTTTIDYDFQLFAEEAVRVGVEANGERLGFENAALVAIDPKSGHILSMVGSKDYFDEEIDGAVNVTTRPRQPGSSFKPIVYTAAFAKGYTPNTILWDVNTVFKTDMGDYAPKNYGEREFGPVTIRQALQGSLNIPAVKTTYLVGLEEAFNFAKRFGYSTFSDLSNYGLSLVLGGAEVKLLEHTNAYAVFANGGRQFPITSILRVEDPDGKVLQEQEPPESIEIISQDLANLTTHVLSDNASRSFIFGASSYLQLGDRPVAAKTGTTNDSKDAWIMGYTPSLAVGVWAGNNNSSAMKDNSGGESAAGPIWNAFMRKALEGTPVESFPVPEIPLTGKGILDGHAPTQTVTIDRASGGLATEFTPDSYKETVTCMGIHSVLHYVDPNDPLGEAPKNPEKDPQYVSWEAGVADWVTRKNAESPENPPIRRCEAPTDPDSLHTRENQPTVRFEAVSVENGRSVIATLSVSAKRPLSRVEYRLDGKYVATSNSYPFSIRFEAHPSFGAGDHSLQAIAYDDIDNNASAETSVSLDEPSRVSAIELLDPKDGQDIENTGAPYSVSLQIRNPSRFSAVSLFMAPRATGERSLVGSVLNPSSPFLTLLWTLPPTGDWILTAVGETKEGQLETTPELIVRVRNPSTESSTEAVFNPFGLLDN
ncbi:MAG: Penicillin-binding protein, 1A family [Candidatus Giovannonibacteria bacterium GW2011_GWA2_53_7]|uniref:peptidoglycan glycosyltransferase n=1 Tax=Candidatus Giovannonibacteria bacterium GW2011_GWA2_53_7 TaxID=1618650 RepID=A0A0G1Y0L6_9BACT|nr:MAG: Penicillin-binding protein, 1A family [Candidatus Giovannonibacteria bacterium GW2011_GWA2_53_7]